MFNLIVRDAVYPMLDEAYWWYEQQMPGLGERLLKEIDSCFEKLSLSPFYYSITGECYRQIMVRSFPYKIVFEISGQDVVIYAIFHTSRNPYQIFG